MPQQRHAALPKRPRRFMPMFMPLLLGLVMMLAAVPGATGAPAAPLAQVDHSQHTAHEHQAAMAQASAAPETVEPAQTNRAYVPMVGAPPSAPSAQPSTAPNPSASARPSASASARPSASASARPSASASARPSASASPRPSASASPRPSTPAPPPPAPPAPIPPGALEPVTWPWIPNCPANTVPYEGQGWWMTDFGHVHAGMCAPQGWTLRGSYTANAFLVLHRNPGVLKLMQLQIDSTPGQNVKLSHTCPTTQTCVFNHQVTYDLSTFPSSGWHQMRLRAVVEEPDGNELVASSFIPIYIDNGKPRNDYRYMVMDGTMDYIAGRGWYTDSEYIWSVIFDPPQVGQTISGVHTFKVRPEATDNPEPISYFVVKIDATHTSPGITVYESTDGSRGETIEIPVDTRTLADGWHSLIARTESTGQRAAFCSVFCSGQEQMHAGDTKIWFYVDN